MTPGFQAHGVVVGWLDLFSAGYTAQQGRAFYARALERVRALARRRIRIAQPPHSARLHRRQLHRHHASRVYTGCDDDPQGVGFNNVGPDYATTMKIPLLAGRDLSDQTTPPIGRRWR